MVFAWTWSAPLTGQELTAEQRQTHERLQKVAKALQSEGKTPETVAALEELLAFERTYLGDRSPAYRSTSVRLLRILELDGRFPRALELRKEAFDANSDQFGAAHWKTTDARLALEHVRKLASLADAPRKDLRQADIATLLADFAHQQGELAAGIKHVREAHAIRSKVLGDDSPVTCLSASLLGLMLSEAGHLDQARPYCEGTLEIRRRILGEDHPQTAVSHNNLGFLNDSQSRFAAARFHYERALSINRSAHGDDHADTAVARHNLGSLLLSAGDAAGARVQFEQALAIRLKRFGERDSATASSLNGMGVFLQANGDHAGAKSYFERALASRKAALGDRHPELAGLLNNLAFAERSLGNLPAAQTLFEQALAIRKKSLGDDHPDTATSLGNLGMLLLAKGDDAAAQSHLEQALAIREKALGPWHINTAESLRNLGDWRLFRKEYVEARVLFERGLSATRQNLELAAVAQSERQQLRMLQQSCSHLDHYLALAVQGALPAADVYAHVLAWKGSVFLQQRRLRLRRQLDAQPEASKTFADLEATANEFSRLAFSAPKSAQLGAWRARMGELSQRKEALEAALASASDTFDKKTKAPTVEALKSALPANAVLVDYLEFTDIRRPAPDRIERQRKFVAFVIRGDRDIALHDLGPAKAIGDAIASWRGRLLRPVSAAANNDPGAEVRRLIFQPLEERLRGKSIVLVAPDGAITGVPFAALPGREKGKFLIEEASVAVVPVPAALPEMLDKKSASKLAEPGLLAVGDIDFDAPPGSDKSAPASALRSSQWARLPATRGEIASLRDSFEQRFPDAKVRTLRGASATESAFRDHAPRLRWLHLATHGFFAPPELVSALGPDKTDAATAARDSIGGLHPGLLSGLALAGANRAADENRDDGILTALEVSQLDLDRVELAVLSACETGLGRLAGGEGALGLQRAFQVAGARSVVASLWAVDDEATRKLIERFYDNLWSKNLSKLEALSEAQRWMLRDGARRGIVPRGELNTDDPRALAPFYWAPFVLSGDWR